MEDCSKDKDKGTLADDDWLFEDEHNTQASKKRKLHNSLAHSFFAPKLPRTSQQQTTPRTTTTHITTGGTKKEIVVVDLASEEPEDNTQKQEQKKDEQKPTRDGPWRFILPRQAEDVGEPLVLSVNPPASVPASIASKLRDYQKEGVKFLWNLYAEGRGTTRVDMRITSYL